MYYVQHYADGRWQSFGVDNSPWEFLTFEDAKAELFEAKNDDHSLKLRILEINAAGWGWSTKFVPPPRAKRTDPLHTATI